MNSRAVAMMFGGWLVFGSTGAAAGPAAELGPTPTAEEASPTPESPPPPPESGEGLAESAPVAAATISVPKVRRELESNMATLGDLAADAKRDSDLVKATCVLDKQERAQGVMELATGELLVIRDEGASTDARSFAAEKLAAASQRLEALVKQARECAGDKTPEDSDDVTRNDVEQQPSIPVADPTVGGGAGGGKPPGLPPPVDDGFPPSVGSPSL
ncbi:MAG: hypothetical protein AB1Z98_39355 [Nannocystaceae bacterium]